MLKLHLQNSKTTIETQGVYKSDKGKHRGRVGDHAFSASAQSPYLVISFSLCPSLCLSLSRFPAARRVLLAAVEEKQNGRGR